MISAKTSICMIIGDPVEQSLSPQMHNAAYSALGIDNDFVYLGAQVTENQLQAAIAGIRALRIKGITVTVPHKIAVMQFLDTIDPTAKEIGAVNTIVNQENKLIGYNTDWIGIAEPLKKIIDIKGKSVVILGAGGAAHAAVFAVKQLGGQITILNRTIEHAQNLAAKFNCSYDEITNTESIITADVIINTTSVGLNSEDCPIDPTLIQGHQIVFDIVYDPYETLLLKEAKKKGATIIHGTDMLLHQGLAQFELFTGKKAPEEVMREVIMNNITVSV